VNIGLYNKGKYKFKCPACETACNGHVKTENSMRVIMVTKDVEAVGSGAEVDEPAPCAGAAMSAHRMASIVMGLAWYGHSAYWGRYVRDSLKKYYPGVDWVPLLEAYVKDRDSPPGIGSPKSFPDGVCPYCGRGEMAEREPQ
jgi:hypothetical protein